MKCIQNLNGKKTRNPTKEIYNNIDNKKTMMKNIHKLKNIFTTNCLSKIEVTREMTKSEREQKNKLIGMAKEKISSDHSESSTSWFEALRGQEKSLKFPKRTRSTWSKCVFVLLCYFLR